MRDTNVHKQETANVLFSRKLTVSTDMFSVELGRIKC